MGWFSSVWNGVKDSVGNFLTGDVVGGTMDLVGGVLGNKSKEKINAANASLTQEQIAYQKELARNQIQWRVEDAKKAGLHPLAGLGVSSASYSPVSANFQAPDYSFLSDMGQNLNRAIQQGKTSGERKQALDMQDRIDNLNLRKAEAEVDLIESQAASERFRLQREMFPPAPTVNTRENPDIATTVNSGRNNGGYANSVPLLTLARHGRVFLDVPNPDIADPISESAFRNALATVVGEAEARQGYVKAPIEYLTPNERKLVKDGVLDFVRRPFGWELIDSPLVRARDGITRARRRREWFDYWTNPRNWFK